jgi:acyl-CoA-binding protein
MSAEFEAALARVNELTQDPGNEAKLKMYALYKQATVGDVEGKRPGFTNPVGRAKYDAWAGVKGMSSQDAEAAYVEFVNSL